MLGRSASAGAGLFLLSHSMTIRTGGGLPGTTRGSDRHQTCLPHRTTEDQQNVLTVARDFDALLVTADKRLHTAATGLPIRLLGP